jgi:membrane peptidoglycan carboxypeptidase
MLEDIGMCPVSKMTDKLGVVQGDGTKLPQNPSTLTLGSNGLSPLTMASAYAAFANHGTYCTPTAIESVKTADGTSLPVPKTSCSQAMSPTTADTINTLLRGVVDSGTGQEAGLQNRDNAGKTGTTDARKNAWFVGYTPNMSGAVWVGSPSQSVEMENITIGGVYQDKVYGGQVPGPIWRDAMTGALEGEPAPAFNTVNIPDAPAHGDGGDSDRPGHGGNKPDKGHGDKNPFPDTGIPPDLAGGNNGGRGGRPHGGTHGH